MSDQVPLSVSELTSRIKAVLEGGLPSLWVRGEISQFTRHRSGHWYFTLSDDRSMLSCVLWRGRTDDLLFTPQVGQTVLVQGRITVYERGGRYQFDCFEIRPAGVGELALAFEALKKKLEAQGLFAMERKVPLPIMPECIGLVTSPDGAALQDILKVARKRSPWVEFRLAPAAVQGAAAPAEIARAIHSLDSSGWPQLIIVGRGGGAPEDLWAFNDEIVVKAIADCRTPIISAVGHEVDVTLADLAADLRAPTPSAAAEMCLPDRESLNDRLRDFQARLQRTLQSRITELRRWVLDYARTVLQQRGPAIWREESQRTDELARRLEAAASLFIERRRSTLEQLRTRHQSADPRVILSRGYSVVRKVGQLKPVIRSDELIPEESIDITFCAGSAEAIVKRCNAN